MSAAVVEGRRWGNTEGRRIVELGLYGRGGEKSGVWTDGGGGVEGCE